MAHNASPEGTPLEERSLIPASRGDAYHQYIVLKEFEVEAGEVAPWFYEPGGGIQYYAKTSTSELIEARIIMEI